MDYKELKLMVYHINFTVSNRKFLHKLLITFFNIKEYSFDTVKSLLFIVLFLYLDNDKKDELMSNSLFLFNGIWRLNEGIEPYVLSPFSDSVCLHQHLQL